jgi:hypothetical protein
MEQPDNMNVQVIENRVFIEGVILSQEKDTQGTVHERVKINILKIEQIENYPDLVTVQEHRDFEMLVRKDDIVNIAEIVGKKFTCIVSWIPFDRLIMLKGSLQII